MPKYESWMSHKRVEGTGPLDARIVLVGVVPTQVERIQLQTTELAAVLDAIADKEVDRAQI